MGKDIRKDQLIRLADEHTRLQIANAMRKGNFEISPPHTAQIPKRQRRVPHGVRERADGPCDTQYRQRPLFDLMPEMLHETCKSYQTGIGCGRVVIEVSHQIVNAAKNGVLGWKSDLSKYFDSVPIQFVDEAFDKVEAKHGHSVLIDVLRKYYHSDLYFDEENRLRSQYQSLKQGCAVASWLADVLLYGLDEELSELNGYYVRYSDDMLFVGADYEKQWNCSKATCREVHETQSEKGGVPDSGQLVQISRV